MATLVNGQYRTSPIPKRVPTANLPAGSRPVSYSYGATVSKSDFDNGILKTGNPNETSVDVYASTGTGRSKVSYGKVGSVITRADGTTEFSPQGRFNELPQAVKNDISSKSHQADAKQAINNQAKKDNLQNNLATNSNGEAGADAANQSTDASKQSSQGTVPSSPFGPETASKPPAGTKYPLLMKDDQDFILFKSEGGGQVALGIQPTIQDSNRQNWGESTLNPFQKAALGAAKNLIGAEDYGAQVGKELKNATEAFTKATDDPTMRGAAATYIAAQALSMDANQLMARSDVGVGMIMNPNLELVYTGPTLRNFTYTFRMTPRSPEEAIACRTIINFFKSNMVPKASEMFFKRPYYFTIKYQGKGATSLNLIKDRCALQDCSVNYTPDGSYMTYQKDGSMTAYSVTLQFSEIKPLTDKDYEDMDQANQIHY